MTVAILLLLLAPTQALAGNWTLQHNQSAVFGALDFVDAQHGWAVGTNGAIVATSNGGATWQTQTSGTTKQLIGVDFVNTSYGWAVGEAGTILTTANGGATWTPQTSGVTQTLYEVSFVDGTRGWACGYSGVILSTPNGGATWTKDTSPFGYYRTTRWEDVAFADSTHGFMAGDDDIAVHTGGTPPWTLYQPHRTVDSYHGVDCASATNAWVVGYGTGGCIAYNTTNGTTWTAVSTGSTEPSFNDVSCPTTNNVWIAGYGGSVVWSTNAGATWSSEIVDSSQLLAIDFPDAAHGWAIGRSGIYKYGATAPPATAPVAKALGNVTVKKGKKAALPFRVTSTASTCTVTLKIMKNKTVKKTLTFKNVKTNAKVTKKFTCKLAKGKYTWLVSATAGGVKSANSASKKLTVK